MKKRSSFLSSIFAVAAVLASTANGATHLVTMTSQNKFSPAVTNILVGDTIVWSNAAFVQHTVTPTNNAETFCGATLLNRCGYTFTQPGSFAYYCIPHYRPPFQTMTGLVIVASPPNTPPTVAITAPQNGTSFAAPASFQISATATDAEGPVTNVEFFVNGVLAGSAQPPVFSAAIQGLQVGSYTLTAIARDSAGVTNAALPVSVTVTQVIVLPRYSLAISVAPANTGTVTAHPGQPEGGYESNTVVALTALATTNFAFQNWSGDAIGTDNPITITMNGARDVTANFAPIVIPPRTLILSTNPAEGGSIHVTPAPNGPNGTYVDGTIVTIAAGPAFAFGFSNWSGAVVASTNPLIISMDSDKAVTANFISTPVTTYSLTLMTNPLGAGTITVDPPPNAPGGIYIADTIITLTASALGTNQFTNWTGDVSESSNQIIITMDSNKTVSANFVPIIPPRYQLIVTVSPTNGGRVAVSPDANFAGTYASNATVALAAFPEHGFRFLRWNGGATSTNNPLLLTLNADTEIVAEFGSEPALDLADLAGVYNGLVFSEGIPDHAASGSLNIRLSKSGAYRGTAMLGGMKQFVAGHFDRFGYSPLLMRRGSLSGSLQLEAEIPRITGVLIGGGKAPTVLLYRAMSSSNASSFAGSYVLTFGTNGAISAESSAMLNVSTRGLVRIRGTLADEAKLSRRTVVNSEARVPLAAVLYGNSGSFVGWLDVMTNATVNGSVQWTRPADSRSRDFPNGFAIQIPVTGARQ